MKTRFIVIDENVLGCVNPRQPDQVDVLRSLFTKGATFRCQADGPIPMPPDSKGVRPAKQADFETFRVSSSGYETCPHCDFPKD